MDRDDEATPDEKLAAAWLRLLDDVDGLREIAERPPAEVAGLLRLAAA